LLDNIPADGIVITADEIIAATSLAYDIPLVTRAGHIRESKLIQFA
jgi:predicted nucleic acid-binding protein